MITLAPGVFLNEVWVVLSCMLCVVRGVCLCWSCDRETAIQDHAFFTTKAAGRGTGLGRAVSRDIAVAHGGWLECTSEPGCSRFTLGLPMHAIPSG